MKTRMELLIANQETIYKEIGSKNLAEQAFNLALEDSKAFEKLFENENRITQNLNADQLAKLLEKHYRKFVEQQYKKDRSSGNDSSNLESTINFFVKQKILDKSSMSNEEKNKIIKDFKNKILPPTSYAKTLSGFEKNEDDSESSLLTLKMTRSISENLSEDELKKLGKDTTILTHEFTAFHRGKVASIGSSLTGKREILVLDPQSDKLKKLYSEFSKNFNKNDAVEDVYKKTQQFINSKFEANNEEDIVYENWIKENKEFLTLENGKKVPVIPLEKYVEEQTGVCRHKALLTSFFWTKLIEDGLLPPGEIHHNRDFIKFELEESRAKHAWLVYKETKNNKLYLIDPEHRKFEEISIHNKNLVSHYGKEAVENMLQRYKSPIEKSLVENKEFKQKLVGNNSLDERMKKSVNNVYQSIISDEERFKEAFLNTNDYKVSIKKFSAEQVASIICLYSGILLRNNPEDPTNGMTRSGILDEKTYSDLCNNVLSKTAYPTFRELMKDKKAAELINTSFLKKNRDFMENYVKELESSVVESKKSAPIIISDKNFDSAPVFGK